jgi:NAD(P)-dependent dehydrogenase (short-subunit alcohol dehydrogenase family)
MRVVVADLYEEGFKAMRQCTCIRCDVADPVSVAEMIEKTVKQFQRIDVLVNCVGGSWGITRRDLISSPPLGFRGLTNCSLEDWRTIVAVNLDAVFYCSAGVMGLTRQLALELGPHGVRVNCVAPGVISSGRLKRVMALTGKERGPEGPMATIPMGRVGTVDECAALIVALCTDDTAYMTGVTVDINGASYAA